jgi:membrane protein
VRLGAGIAYYSLFALVPVLFLAVSLAGFFFGQDVAGGAIEDAISDAVGPELAAFVVLAIDRVQGYNADSLLPLFSIGALLFSASLLFVAWRDVVAIIWDVPRESGVRAKLRRRLFGLAAVLGSGVLLTLVIFAQTLVGTLDSLLATGALDVLLRITSSIVPALLGAVFLAVLFKYTLDFQIAWRSVWLAAAVTIAMLSVGAWGYGIYLDAVGLKSASGVAGTLLLGLALVYYSAQILLFGVEVTKEAHARSEDTD